MKKALPANGKIAKDAKEIMQECVSEFISFITSEEKRKTINGDDLLWAMATLGFEDYIDPLKLYLLHTERVTPRDRQRVEMGRLGKMQLELNQALIPT
ncbi:Nuclear transcription factor Y subunit B-10 [Vitis vinifera]|uniref:Nuclear transcription factor Y subunit B-10 n=1 Tax=Vitis vinifera TaxID=29760 RepID=A0A438DVZ5_VITVI|nr:Nuclear transcription factor Y subunit B-10 [Vitis vinifera]